MTWSAETIVDEPREVVQRALLHITDLPVWNPAISAVRAPSDSSRVGVAYPVTIRGLVSAHLTLTSIEPDQIGYELRGMGFAEVGSWLLTTTGAGATRVRHSFSHSGPALRLMRGAFEGVAEWRVRRLREHLHGRGQTVP